MMDNDWDWKVTVREHRKIAEAIYSEDAAKAEEEMKNHLQLSYQGFMKLAQPIKTFSQKLH
jgi:DNA-binding GntR family transcriptional regulator